MPTVAFTDYGTDPADIFLRAIDRLSVAPITGWGASVTYLVTGAFGYEIRGTGLTYSFVDGVRALTGGTITSILVNFDQTPSLTLSGLSLNAATLHSAILADANGTPDAVETLFGALGWAYTGKSGRDVLLETSLTSDGAQLNLSGNDSVSTGGGRDDFWLGDGNDLASGGSGNDRLWGGRGADTLRGDTQNDSLDGGADADLLNGGRGNDTLTGGAGADTFAFVRRDGQDRITDFDLALDRIDLPDGIAVSFSDLGADTLLTYGRTGDQIVLIGVDAALAGQITLI